MMDLIRRLLHGGEPSFTPIPGAYPEGQSEAHSTRNERPEEQGNGEPPAFKRSLLSAMAQLPFVLLYYIMNLTITMFSLLKPLCAINGFYRKKHRRSSDAKSRLNHLLETLSNESQRTLNLNSESADATTYSFGSLYNMENGSLSEDIVQGSYTELLSACSEQCKLAIIYLHAPLLDNNMEYVNGILCFERFTTLIKKYQVLLWFSDVTTSEGLQVANALKVRQFPFLGILCLKAEKKLEVIGRMEGDINKYGSNALENILSKGYSRLIQIRQQRQNSALQRLIREQQDNRFEESLRVDQQRERDREALRSREIDQADRERIRKQWLLWRKAQLCPEPPNGPDVCRVALRIEGGGRTVRKFNASLTIEEIYAYAELYMEGILDSTEVFNGNSPPIGYHHEYKFILITPVPRRELSPATLIRDESAIYPSGNILMEMLN